MCVRLFRTLVFGAIVSLCGFSTAAQQPNRELRPLVLPPTSVPKPVPKQPAAPNTFQFDQRRDQVPFRPPATERPFAPSGPRPKEPWELILDGVFKALAPEVSEVESSDLEERRPQSPPSPPGKTRPVPSARRLASLTDQQLLTVLDGTRSDLEGDLGEFNTGEGWKKHLKLGEIEDTVAELKGKPIPNATRIWFATLTAQFDQVAKDEGYAKISSLWGFRVTHLVLRELARPSVQRWSHQVALHRDTLHGYLKRIERGSDWIAYMELDKLAELPQLPTDWKTEDIRWVTGVADRFGKVREDPAFAMVARQPGFPELHIAITSLMQSLKEPPTGVVTPEAAGRLSTALAPPSMLPDLVVTKVEYDDQTNRAWVTVKNQGRAVSAGCSLRVEVFKGRTEGTAFGGPGVEPPAASFAGPGTEPPAASSGSPGTEPFAASVHPQDRLQPSATAAGIELARTSALSRSLQPLDTFLSELPHGKDWRKEVGVNKLMVAAGTSACKWDDSHWQAIGETKRKFDRLASDPHYQPVFNWPGMADLHAELSQLVAVRQSLACIRPTITFNPARINILKREPIEFKPFEMIEPGTGKPVAADAELTLPDSQKVRAGDYYSMLNRTERELCALGHTLRGPEKTIVLQKTTLPPDLLQKQQAEHEAELLKVTPEAQAALGFAWLRPRRTASVLLEPAKDIEVPPLEPGKTARLLFEVPGQLRLLGNVRFALDSNHNIRESDETNNVWRDDLALNLAVCPYGEFLLGDEPPPTRRTAKEVHTVKEWERPMGDPDYFATKLRVKLELHGTPDHTSVRVVHEVTATIYNQMFRLVRATGEAHAPRSGPGTAKIDVALMGRSIRTIERSGNDIQLSDSASYISLDRMPFLFDVASIPVAEELVLGIRIKVPYEIVVRPGAAFVEFAPKIEFVDATVDRPADVLTGSPTLCTKMHLFKPYDGTARCTMAIGLDAEGNPFYYEAYDYHHSFESLVGESYAFKKVLVPRNGDPPWKEKLSRWNEVEFAGFEADGQVLQRQRSTALYGDKLVSPID